MAVKRTPAQKKKVANTRPKLWTEKQTRKAMEKALPGTFGVGADLAYNLGIRTNTLYEWQKKYPWIKEMRDEARDVAVDTAEGKLFKKVQEEEDWAIKYTLGTLGRKRGYGNEQKVEVTGTINHVSIGFEPPKEFIDITPPKDELEDKTNK